MAALSSFEYEIKKIVFYENKKQNLLFFDRHFARIEYVLFKPNSSKIDDFRLMQDNQVEQISEEEKKQKEKEEFDADRKFRLQMYELNEKRKARNLK